jgi:hypothetical protein
LTLLAEYDNCNYVELSGGRGEPFGRRTWKRLRHTPRATERETGMRRRFMIFGVTACAVAMLGLVPSALAATPQQIYRDYAQHGRLTHNYSRSDLQRALRDAALQGYPRVGVQGAVQQALGAQAVKSQGGLPFTGLDLALMAAGGAALLAAGTGMRALGRAKK